MLEQFDIDTSYPRKSTPLMPDGFNWIAILKDIKAGAPITDLDHEKLKRLAGNWPTCACGQLCSGLSRRADRSPLDPELHRLGMKFFYNVEVIEWSTALEVFHEIEIRTIELLELNSYSGETESGSG